MKHTIKPLKTIGLAMLLLMSVLIVSCGQSLSPIEAQDTVLETLADKATQEAPEAPTVNQEQLDLETAWQEYYNSWDELDTAFATVATDWAEIPVYWNEISEGWQEIGQTWDTVAADWQELDQARTIVHDSLGILLTDAETRITRDVYVRSSFSTATSTVTAPTKPQATTTVGTWAELDSAWDELNNAWSSIDAAFAELTGAWTELYKGYEEVSLAWPFVDQAFQQISVAYDAVDDVWAQHK